MGYFKKQLTPDEKQELLEIEANRQAAQNMVEAASSAGLCRMIYFVGLAEAKDGIQPN